MSRRRRWTTFAPEKKGDGISVWSTRLFCFVRAEGLFSFAVLHPACLSRSSTLPHSFLQLFLSPSRSSPPFSSLSRRLLFSRRNQRPGKLPPSLQQSKPDVARKSRSGRTIRGGEELEETHKHPSRVAEARAPAVGCHFHRGKITSLALSSGRATADRKSTLPRVENGPRSRVIVGYAFAPS